MADTARVNQVMLLTPPGMAAVATVRLTGDLLRTFIQKHLSKPPVLHRCVHLQLVDQDDVIDDPLAVLVNEYTLDLSLHGSTWIVQKTIEMAERAGFQICNTCEELTPDNIEREVLLDLPKALTEEGLKILLAQPEAWRRMISTNDHLAKAQATADRSLDYLLNPPSVAIVGIPNAGKSTLANRLFSKDHSITADLPGTTRDWIGEKANIDGLVITLIDTPGVRETIDPIEAAAIAQSKDIVQLADLVIELFDVSQPRELQPRRFNRSICVANKIDATRLWHDDQMIQISATTGSGETELRNAILKHFGCHDLQSLHARAWTKRQRDLLTQ